MKSPINYFSNLTDSRVERTKEHLLDDIIFMAIAAVANVFIPSNYIAIFDQ